MRAHWVTSFFSILEIFPNCSLLCFKITTGIDYICFGFLLALGAAEITAAPESHSKLVYVESAAGHISPPVLDFVSLNAGQMKYWFQDLNVCLQSSCSVPLCEPLTPSAFYTGRGLLVIPQVKFEDRGETETLVLRPSGSEADISLS